MVALHSIPSEREPPDSTIARALVLLTPLVGVWEGRGRGEFPTIDPFDYMETLRIARDGDAPFLTYEQSTVLIDPEGVSIKKGHWEAGVIRPRDDGAIILSNAQDSARVEVLEGRFLEGAKSDEVLVLSFQSIVLENDPRMVGSSREFLLSDGTLRYTMSMETSKVREMTFHLESTLERAAS